MPESAPPQTPAVVRMPIVRLVPDGQRVVYQVVGSTTTPPGAINGRYIGANGYVEAIEDAVDVRGPVGGSATGTQGQMGSPGADGKSAYTVWLEAGHSGSETTFLASLVGPQGAQGTPGLAGASVKGDTGATGSNGATGAKGDTGATGPSGSTLIGTATLSESALVTLALAVRRVTVALTGTVTAGSYVAIPVSAPPAGYSVQDAVCSTAGQITVGLLVPTLGIGSSYSIPVRVYRLG